MTTRRCCSLLGEGLLGFSVSVSSTSLLHWTSTASEVDFSFMAECVISTFDHDFASR